MKLWLYICIDNSSSKGSSNSRTYNLLSFRTVLIWFEIVNSEAFCFNCLNDLILSLFLLNYSWRYKIQKPKETLKVMLKLQSTLILRNAKRSFYFNTVSTISQQASYFWPLFVSSSLFSSLIKITSKTLPLVSWLGERTFCWQSAEIRPPYYLGSLYSKWLALKSRLLF